MTTIVLRQAAAAPAPSATGLLASVRATLRRAVRLVRDRRRLQTMPDSMLRDIGLSRSDVGGALCERRDPALLMPRPLF